MGLADLCLLNKWSTFMLIFTAVQTSASNILKLLLLYLRLLPLRLCPLIFFFFFRIVFTDKFNPRYCKLIRVGFFNQSGMFCTMHCRWVDYMIIRLLQLR